MSEVPLERGGLPVRKQIDHGILTPASFQHDYRAWLHSQARGTEDLPAGTLRFLDWWIAEQGRPVRKPVVPTAMTPGTLVGWWLTWCRETRRERLVPFDLLLFLEWWAKRASRT